MIIITHGLKTMGSFTLNIPTYDEYYENPKQFNGGGRRKKTRKSKKVKKSKRSRASVKSRRRNSR
jgi:hypothetical protein